MPTVLQRLNESLHQAFAENDRVHLIGEDLLDPYGGAFKVSAGLSSKYPERVLSSPISEAGIVGLAGGMALRGLLPVVEIMFGDFTTLIADQLINSLTKFRWMYNDQVEVPVVIRTPMGGRRGYGPTHSQSLEKLFLGTPGLRVLAINTIGDPGKLLQTAILHDPNPVLFLENKLLYAHKLREAQSLSDFEVHTTITDGNYAPAHLIQIKDAPNPSLTLAAYGYMAELAIEALTRLAFEEEIFGELYIPSQLAPLPDAPHLDQSLTDSLRRTKRILTLEEGSYAFGWGAEIAARAAQSLGDDLISVGRVAAADQNIPASITQEAAVLPSVDDIMAAAREMV